MNVGEINAEVGLKLDGLTADLARMEAKIDGSAQNAAASVKSVGTSLAGAFAGLAIGQMVGDIVRVRSEFERFGAVLTNTLGSSSLAQQALNDIREFAANTPFEVAQLADAYVKLTNRGLQPSMEAMRALGDVASSTGKTFDMLAEAVLDATTGEFERLKEFGIRASKSGDQVTFAFKGVETQVEFTEQAINDYILSLGNLEGVQGSMAAQMDTLGGKVSNLKDAWSSLLVSLGNSGVYKAAVSGLTNIISQFGEMVEEFSNLSRARQNFTDDEIRAIGGTTAAVNALTKARAKQAEAAKKETGGGGGGKAKPKVAGGKGKGKGKESEGDRKYMAALANATVDLSDKSLQAVGSVEMLGSAMAINTEQIIGGTTATEALIAAGARFNEQMLVGQEITAYFGSGLQQTFAAALFSGQSFFETFGNYLLNLVQQLIAAAAAALVLSLILSSLGGGFAGGASIGQLFKSNFSAMAGIPALASGGITTGPTLAMIGDNPGGQEVVMPLSKLQGMMGNSGGGEFRIAGEDLVTVTKRTDRANARYI